MQLRQFFDSATGSFTYLVFDAKTRQAALLDPLREHIERDLGVIDQLGLDLVYVGDTHVHADHVTGSGLIRQRTGARSVISARAGVPCADIHVDHGDRLAFGGLEMRIIATPGHTAGCVSYRIGGAVFTGDALLVRGCGRTDFQQGDAHTLYRSITERLFELPDATVVYPGHDYRGHTKTTIGEEKRFNPRVGGGRRAVDFVDIMSRLDLAAPRGLQEALPANRACGMLSRSHPHGRGGAEPEPEAPFRLKRVAGWP